MSDNNMERPLDNLREDIEILRAYLHKISKGRALTDELVVKISQELDLLLVKYQRSTYFQF